MTTYHQVYAHDALATAEPTTPLSKWISSFGQQLATWAGAGASYYTAAAIYEQLSALSDAELTRRGLSRATLAHDVCAACDRDADR